MSNPIDISAKLNGLIPYEKYNYVFTTTSSNWPTVISPISGSFVASSVESSIDATVYFCPSKTACNNCDGLLPYEDCLCDIGDGYFSKIQLSCSLDSDPTITFNSDTIKVVCNNCLPKAEIVSSMGADLPSNVKSKIHYVFDNLKHHKTYEYHIETIHSNWPFYLSSTSGLITSSGVKDIVEAFGVYCANTGECPTCDAGVLPYISNTGCSGCFKNPWKIPETSFRLLLTDPDCPTVTYYSNVLNLHCKDCGQNYISVSVEANDLKSC